MQSELLNFFRGGTMVALIGCAVFFFRFWRQTKDRLFAYFTVSFLVMAVSHALVVFLGSLGESLPHAYLVRLLAFLLIAVGIIEKNLPKKEIESDQNSSN